LSSVACRLLGGSVGDKFVQWARKTLVNGQNSPRFSETHQLSLTVVIKKQLRLKFPNRKSDVKSFC